MSRRVDKKYFSQETLWKPPVQEQLAVAADVIGLIPDDIDSILDVGCGNGAVTNLLAGANTFATDISLVALRTVQAPRFAADLAALPLADRSFDLVLATDVVEHLPASIYEQALAEIMRVAGRYVLIAVPYREALVAAQVHCPHCGTTYHAHNHQRTYDAESAAALFGSRFGAVKVQESGERWLYAGNELPRARNTTSGLDYPFPEAVCERCGEARGDLPRGVAASQVWRQYEALQAMQVCMGLTELPTRSELLVLFERGRPDTEFALDVVGRRLRPPGLLEITPRDLPSRADPGSYAQEATVIERSDTHVTIALPCMPRSVELLRGGMTQLEVYDHVDQAYLRCERDGTDRYEVPAITHGPLGCLLRVVGLHAESCLRVCFASMSEQDVLERVFSSTAKRLVARLTDVSMQLDVAIDRQQELESRREALEAIVRRRDSKLVEVETALDQSWRQAERLELARAELERMIGSKEEGIRALGDELEIARTHASRVEVARESLEALVVAKDLSYATLNAERAEEAARLRRTIQAQHMVKGPLRGDRPQTSQRPKVLVLSHMYPRNYHPAGGVFVHEQVQALRAFGVDARVMSGEPFWINTYNPIKILKALREWLAAGEYAWQDHDGVPVIHFPYIVSRTFLPFEMHSLSYRYALSRAMQRLRDQFAFDVVHAHTAYTDGAAGADLCAVTGQPLVITEHTGPFSTLTRNPVLRRRTQKSLNAADRILAVSSSLLADIREEVRLAHPERCLVLPNLVKTQLFEPRPKPQREELLALWVGHFVPVKRVDRLLRAFAVAGAHQPRLRLRLVGSGPLEEDMRRLAVDLNIVDRIEFSGPATREELVGHYAECDFLVISSDTETFGLVGIEALSCGRPVLSTRCGGPADAVASDQVGRVVPATDEGLAEGLSMMCDFTGQFEPLLLAEYARLAFSAESVAAALLDVYATLLAGSDARR